MNEFLGTTQLARASVEVEEYRQVLFALWLRGEDFPWQSYFPSFNEFMKEAKEWADARP